MVAGEISGDHHAAPVIAALKARNPEHRFWGLGGDDMIREGLNPLYHVKDLSVTGFIEVIKHLSFFRGVMSKVVEACTVNRPDAAILIDYPGFNIRLGLKLHAMGIPVYYYISPQVWAWKKGRVKVMRKFIKHLFVIFPFEESFFKKHAVPVTFVGHPLVDSRFELGDRRHFMQSHDLDPEKPFIAILPGSRRNELERLVAPLRESILLLQGQFPDHQFVIAGLSSLKDDFYAELLTLPGVTLVTNDPHPVMAYAEAAIVASGTASLETAFLGTPLVVIYKISPLSYIIGKLLVHIDHLAMPNLILGERVIPELIQGDANARRIADELGLLLTDPEYRNKQINGLTKLRHLLGEPGCADLVADKILKDLS